MNVNNDVTVSIVGFGACGFVEGRTTPQVITMKSLDDRPGQILPLNPTQRAQYPLIKEYTVNCKGVHIMI